MTPELEKFIDLATRPLEPRPEQRDEARGELMGRLSHQGVPVERIDVSGPTERLEAARRMPDPWRRGLLLGGLLLLLGLLLFGAWRDVSSFLRAMYASELVWRGLRGDSAEMSRWDLFFYDWIDERAPELPLSGRPGEIEDLRQRQPEDLVVLQEALLRRPIEENEFMRPDERALVARLDADNALWPALEMLWEFHKAKGLEFGGRYFGGSRSLTPDKAAEARGWERFAEVVGLERFESYGRLMVRRQVEACAPERGVFDGLMVSGLKALPRSGSKYGSFYFSGGNEPFGGAVEARISELLGSKESDELQRLFSDWKKLQRLTLGEVHPDPWALQSFGANAASPLAHFQSAFTTLGMPQEAEEAKRVADGINAAPGGIPYRARRAEAGIRLMESSSWNVEFTPEEMRPGRKADIAMFQRMIGWIGVLIALVFVLLWAFEACRRSAVVKAMARQLMPLIAWRDHVFIGIVGIALPWLYWWVVTRLTPVGVSDMVFEEEWVAVAWILQMAIGLTLGLVMLTQAVLWRWSRAGGFLGMRGQMSWLGWVVAGLVALALPASGMLRFLSLTNDEEQAFFLLGCAGMGSLGLLWLLWVGIFNLCTLRQGALRPNVAARTMVPWALAGMASLMVAMGVLRFAEGWWYRRDPLLPGSTSEHYANAVEERGVLQEAAKLREALGE
jgi:hypothetical protein